MQGVLIKTESKMEIMGETEKESVLNYKKKKAGVLQWLI